jgi:hypothetical protein
VPATVEIPTGSYYAYFRVDAQDTIGTVQVQASASGFSPAAMTVQVTQPRFVISADQSAFTTSGPQYFYVYSASANGNAREVREDVVVTLASSAPGVATIDSVTVTIKAGDYYNDTPRWQPVSIGTARISASDARADFYRYSSDTASVTVYQPYVAFSWETTASLGLGQYLDQHIYLPDYSTTDIAVAFSRVGTPRTSTVPENGVVIASGGYYGQFRLIGQSSGTDSLVASVSSPAHRPDTAYTIVGEGRIDPIQGWPTALAVGDSVSLTLYSRTPNQGTARVVAGTTWTLAPNANLEFRSGGASSGVISTVTIPADGYFVTFYVKAIAPGTGSATITSQNYSTYTNSITVNP